MVTEFQFFKLNAAGVVDSASRLRLPDDAAALAHARSQRENACIEVWAGTRRVAVVPPSRPAA